MGIAALQRQYLPEITDLLINKSRILKFNTLETRTLHTLKRVHNSIFEQIPYDDNATDLYCMELDEKFLIYGTALKHKNFSKVYDLALSIVNTWDPFNLQLKGCLRILASAAYLHASIIPPDRASTTMSINMLGFSCIARASFL